MKMVIFFLEHREHLVANNAPESDLKLVDWHIDRIVKKLGSVRPTI